MNNPKIQLCGVGKNKNGVVILKDINLEFLSGKKYILVGPSGAGKTTFLRLLNRMDDPSYGEIIYDGKNIKEIPVLELRRKVGMVFQIPVTFDGTVRDNLMLPYRLGVAPDRSQDKREPEEALELVGLETELLDRKASLLSVGEKQRLTIARALMNKPDVLILDEPTSALDSASAKKLIRSINGLNRLLGLTVIMVTHQVEYAELFGGRIIYMAGGTVVKEWETK